MSDDPLDADDIPWILHEIMEALLRIATVLENE